MENDTVKRQRNINYYRSNQELNTVAAYGVQKTFLFANEILVK